MFICAGIKEASDEQYNTAINAFFTFILAGRSFKSIEGEFLTTDIDRKLADVENEIKQMKEKTDSTDTIVKKILDYCERLDPVGGKT